MINYQGKVTDAVGTPVPDDTYTMQFRIYNTPNGGSPLWNSGNINVTVSDGIFEVSLGETPQPALNLPFDEDYWLLVTFDGTNQLPRQQMVSTGYSYMSSGLVPGTEISGSMPGGYILRVENESSGGVAIEVESSNISPPSAAGPAIVANTTGACAAIEGHALGGFSGQTGVLGTSNWSYGVKGSVFAFGGMGNHYGVYGEYTGGLAGGPGVGVGGQGGEYGGIFTGQWVGVQGFSTSTTNSAGVYGEPAGTDGYGVVGVQPGLSTGDVATWYASGGYFGGDNGIIGLSKTFAGYGVFALAESDANTALYALTDNVSNNYGVFTPDNLYSLNYNLSGAVMHVMENDDTESLMPGDVVVFSGIAFSSDSGDSPIPRVKKSRSENSTAVAGVVYDKFYPVSSIEQGDAGSEGMSDSPDGPISRGDRLLVVVQGPARVNVSDDSGKIQPGDLLSSSRISGYSVRAPKLKIDNSTITPPGCIIGKALEPMESGESSIYAFVTLK